MHQGFNRRCLQFMAIMHIIVGCLLPILGQVDVIAEFLAAEIFPGMSLSSDVKKQVVYLITLFGPTVASWGILFLVLCNSYFSSPSSQKWNGMFAAVLLWFIGDTTYSLMHGVYFALVLNSLAAIGFVIPLLLCRKELA